MQISNDMLRRRVHYYETDAMKIAHHSCYVKWMEEARTEFFRNAGFLWSEVEKKTGIMIPVLFQSVEYKHMLTFDEEFQVACTLEKFNGVKMEFHYTFFSCDTNAVAAIGLTKHGFIDSRYKPLALQHCAPDLYDLLDLARKR